jgi:putative membrane protein
MSIGPIPPPPVGPATGPLPIEEWRRLHPLSPVARVGRTVVVIVFVLLAGVGSPGAPRSGRQVSINLIAYGVLILLSLVERFIAWIVTRWRIHGSDLQIEMGLIRRQSFRIPLARIQAVDVVSPLFARILGLAEVRVVSAGRGLERGRLAYVTDEQAHVIRAPETPAPPARVLLQVDNLQLAGALLLTSQVMMPLFLILALGLTVLLLAPGAASGIIGTMIGALIIHVLSIGRAFNEDYNFTISESPDGLRLDRGLLQQRHETIPFTRIQGVRRVEPLLWRLTGWSRVEVDVARQSSGRNAADADALRVSRTLLPVGRRDQTAWLLWHLMPGAQFDPPPGSAVPSRAFWKAPLSAHFLAAWHDATYFFARTGRLQASTVIVPLRKVQSVRLVSGPLQRALGLATVHVDTAGRRWQAAARARDEAEARSIVDDVVIRARQARTALPG